MAESFKQRNFLLKFKWTLGPLVFITLIIYILAWFDVFMGQPSLAIGVLNNRLTPCEKNSVCYVSRPPESDPHYIHSILPQDSWPVARDLLKSYFQNEGCGKPAEESHEYLRFQCRTFFFRTMDDIEFYFSDSEGRAHIKFHARVSWLDWGRQLRQIRQLRSNIGRPDDPTVGTNW